MEKPGQRGKTVETPKTDERERNVPFRTFLLFALLGSTILFLSLTAMFIVWTSYHPPIGNFALPKAFVISTIVLLMSSYLVTLTGKFYKSDNLNSLLIALGSTLVLAVVFSFLQISGWKEMYSSGHYFNGLAGITFLYLITGLHFAHLAGGAIYLIFMTLSVYSAWQDPVKGLLFCSNPYEKMRLDLFGIYWHFVDGLWLFIFLTFLFVF